MPKRDDLMNRSEAAAYLGVSSSWLAKHGDDGPTATHVGRKVIYTRADLDAYLVAQRGVKRANRGGQVARDKAPGKATAAAHPRQASVDVTGAFATMTRGNPTASRDRSTLPNSTEISQAVRVLARAAPSRSVAANPAAPTTRIMSTESLAPLIARSRPSSPPPLPGKNRFAKPPNPPPRRRP